MKNNVKVYRVLRDLKQENLADLLGITVSTFSMKESGKSKFTLLEAKKLADLFNITIEDLFFTHKVNFKNT